METKSIGFIGGGRITRIFLERFQNAGKLPLQISVSDTSEVILNTIKEKFPSVDVFCNANKRVAEQDIVFISLHPPVLLNVLEEIKDSIRKDAILVSLAPKISSKKISEALGGFQRIVRMIPNSPSIIGKGYNPVWYTNAISDGERKSIELFLGVLGESHEVDEELLEAYVLTTAMGPTYFQFQMEVLKNIAVEFGMPEESAKTATLKMIEGAASLWADPSYSFQDVYDLIPVKPLGEDEELFRKAFKERLTAIYNKIKPIDL